LLNQIVSNYEVLVATPPRPDRPAGVSASPKGMIFHVLDDNAAPVEVLDIGFGVGGLGRMIKANSQTSHWSVDGIDGWAANCANGPLFARQIYRNVWHGLAQELPSERIASYKIICLLDVIEHLNADTAKWLLRTLLTNLGEQSYLFVSTPLWFYPQHHAQDGDLEEHLIGVPASSMMALEPRMYSVANPLIGGFVFDKSSLELIELFQPTADKTFTFQRGLRVSRAVNMNCQPGVVFKTAAYAGAS